MYHIFRRVMFVEFLLSIIALLFGDERGNGDGELEGSLLH